MPKTSPVGGEKSNPGTHPKDPGGTQTYVGNPVAKTLVSGGPTPKSVEIAK